MTYKVAFVNQKGGVGKTTTALNMATAVAALGHKVLLVDFDPQGNASTGMGVQQRTLTHHSYSVLWNPETLNQAIIPTCVPGLDILPTNASLAGAEIECASLKQRRHHVLTQALAQLSLTYTYVFLDCPPSLGFLTTNALTYSDSIIIPMQCEFFALEGLAHLMKTMKILQRTTNAPLKVEGIVLTMYDGRSLLNRHVVKDLRQHMAQWLYHTVIPRNVRVAEAPSFGKPVLLHDTRCVGAVAYVKLAKEFLSRHNQNISHTKMP